MWVDGEELAASGDLRLEPWGRIEGTLKIGREVGAGERVNLFDNIRNGRSARTFGSTTRPRRTRPGGLCSRRFRRGGWRSAI